MNVVPSPFGHVAPKVASSVSSRISFLHSVMSLKEFGKLVLATFWEWWYDNTFRLAAALAFYTVFSLAPILLIAISLAGLVFDAEFARNQVASQIIALVGEEGGRAVEEVMAGSENFGSNPLAAFIGIATLIIGSTVVFAELQSALNDIWGVKAQATGSGLTKMIRDRILSFGLVLALVFLLLVSMLVDAAVATAQEYVWRDLPGWPRVSWTINAVCSFAIISFLFALIYKYLPDVVITWRDVAIGSLVTAVLFIAGKFGIGLYLGRMAFGSTYGAAGSFVVLLIWVYYSALISFFGAEFTQVYTRRYGSLIEPQSYAKRTGAKPSGVYESPEDPGNPHHRPTASVEPYGPEKE